MTPSDPAQAIEPMPPSQHEEATRLAEIINREEVLASMRGLHHPPLDYRLAASLARAYLDLRATQIEGQWRTMESARRNGTPILAFFPDWDTSEVVIFHNERWCMITGINGVLGMRGQPQPTHWQPLPPAPAAPSSPVKNTQEICDSIRRDLAALDERTTGGKDD